MFSHILPREVPERGVGIRGVEVDRVNVTKTVLVTSVVGDPDVVTSVSNKEARSLFFIVDNERIRRIKETMVNLSDEKEEEIMENYFHYVGVKIGVMFFV